MQRRLIRVLLLLCACSLTGAAYARAVQEQPAAVGSEESAEIPAEERQELLRMGALAQETTRGAGSEPALVLQLYSL